MRKIERACQLINQQLAYFCCPICHTSMRCADHSMICQNKHCYDIAKSGYLNLLPQANQSAYSKELFLARKEVIGSELFNPLLQRLAEIIQQMPQIDEPEVGLEQPIAIIKILDAGCGEGSMLDSIMTLLKDQGFYQGIGIDISKDSIKMAAESENDIIWCVSDLANLPFTNTTFNIVLNILSPANYLEFKRIIQKPGYIIKVVPEANYLKEIRQLVKQEGMPKVYSNQAVVKLFKEQLNLIWEEELQYTFLPDRDLWQKIIQMTPLTLGIDKAILHELIMPEETELTIALRILVGTN